MRVWTKQSEKVFEILSEQGRYVAKRLFVKRLGENNMILPVYDWLARNHPGRPHKPADADYPVWLSLSCEGTMQLTPGTVLLELEIPDELITRIDVVKWTAMMNRGYLHRDEEDSRRHRELLRSYGLSDAAAYESQFYPHIKREIEESWQRLFDPECPMGGGLQYGNVWELRKEWLLQCSFAEGQNGSW